MDYVIPRGESRRQLQARARAAWADLLADATARKVAVVTHGGTIRLLLAIVSRLKPYQVVHRLELHMIPLGRNAASSRVGTLR